MAKINDTSVFPITAPASSDLLLGTDRSNTSNDANGETVNFQIGDLWTVLSQFTAGETRKFYATTVRRHDTPTWLSIYRYRFWGSGTLRLKYEFRHASNTLLNAGQLRVVVNGVQVYIQGTNFTTFQARQTDIAVGVGELFDIQINMTAGSGDVEVRNVELLTDGEPLLPFGNNESTWDLTI